MLLISFCIELLLLCLPMSELFQETFVSFSLLISILYILMILAGYASIRLVNARHRLENNTPTEKSCLALSCLLHTLPCLCYSFIMFCGI